MGTVPAGLRDGRKDVLSSTVKNDCGGPGRSVPALLTTAKLHLNSVMDLTTTALPLTISNKHVHLVQPKRVLVDTYLHSRLIAYFVL
jgi:hypothetical protein